MAGTRVGLTGTAVRVGRLGRLVLGSVSASDDSAGTRVGAGALRVANLIGRAGVGAVVGGFPGRFVAIGPIAALLVGVAVERTSLTRRVGVRAGDMLPDGSCGVAVMPASSTHGVGVVESGTSFEGSRNVGVRTKASGWGCSRNGVAHSVWRVLACGGRLSKLVGGAAIVGSSVGASVAAGAFEGATITRSAGAVGEGRSPTATPQLHCDRRPRNRPSSASL